jgi:hypothetical protein
MNKKRMKYILVFFNFLIIGGCLNSPDVIVQRTPTAEPIKPSPKPSISNLSVVITKTTATFTWITNKTVSDSQVRLGAFPGKYLESKLDEEYVTAHKIKVDGLRPGLTYYYRVVSTSSDGVEVQSEEHSFTTEINLCGNGQTIQDQIDSLYPNGGVVNLSGNSSNPCVYDISNYSFTNLDQDNLEIRGQGWGATILRSSDSDSHGDGVFRVRHNKAANNQTYKNFKLIGNYKSNNAYAFRYNAGNNSNVIGVWIENFRHAVLLGNGTLDSAITVRNFTINNSHFENFGNSIIKLFNAKGIWIHNNTIKGGARFGIEFQGGAVRNVIVSRNEIAYNNNDGVRPYSANKDNFIIENKIHNNKNSGVLITGRQTTVRGNEIYNNFYCGVSAQGSPSFNNSKILENRIHENGKGRFNNSRDGICIEGIERANMTVYIEGNVIYNESGNGIECGDLTNLRCYVKGNIIFDNGMVGIKNSGNSTSVISTNNIMYDNWADYGGSVSNRTGDITGQDPRSFEALKEKHLK